MRLSLAFPVMAGCVAAGLAVSSSAALADWNNPYVYRESYGNWTNVEYNDGTCHYWYSHNAADQHTNLNRWGDCSHVAIGPDGTARPIIAAPVYAAPAPVYATPIPDDGY